MGKERISIINNWEEENEELRAYIKHLKSELEEVRLECKELEGTNRELVCIAFPDATRKVMEAYSSIAKTLKESGLGE